MKSADAPLLDAYSELEARVLAALRSDLTEADFGDLALAIHGFQRQWNAPYAGWCKQQPTPKTWQEIPAVPQAMFKRFRLTCFPPTLTTKTFRTSGTTGETRGEHHLRDTRLYDAAVVMGWKRLRLANHLAYFLTPSPLDVPDSSLLHMFGTLGRTYFRARSFGEGTFLCKPDGRLDENHVAAVLAELSQQRAASAFFGTALSFLNLFEWMGKQRVPLVSGSYALETGGFKGSGRDIAKPALYRMFEERLGIPATHVWNEYGMCELGSQFYTPGISNPHTAGPWVRALVVSPHTGREVEIGDRGILRIFDLVNVGSVLAIQTADLAIRRETGFELLGRDPAAIPRGCSRSADEAMQPAKTTVPAAAPQSNATISETADSALPLPPGCTEERAIQIAVTASPFSFLGEVSAGALIELVTRELGHPDVLDCFVPYGMKMTRAIAPRTILHVFSGNTPAAALQSLIRGLLLGAHNLCKLPAIGIPEVHEFIAKLPPDWQSAIEVASELPEAWLSQANAIVVFGADSTIEHFHSRIRPGQIFIPHGHRLSFGLVLDDLKFSSVPGAARDVSIFDQQGCLSPHVFFVRERGDFTAVEYAERLAKEMAAYAAHTPPAPLNLSEANAIRSLREEIAFRAANAEPVRLFASERTDWTVIADATPGFPSTPLNRVIFVKPLPDDLPTVLAPVKDYLSTVSIHPSTLENAEFATTLGALRICPIGQMQNPPLTWHHDGAPILARMVRWIDWEPDHVPSPASRD